MAELLQGAPTRWLARCRCGSVIKYTKKDVCNRTGGDALIPVKINVITCPECEREVIVYFNRPYYDD